MIIDLDSHLREGYFMDEVYNLPEPYARFTPQKAGEGRNHNTKWIHQLDPGDPQGRAAPSWAGRLPMMAPTRSRTVPE